MRAATAATLALATGLDAGQAVSAPEAVVFPPASRADLQACRAVAAAAIQAHDKLSAREFIFGWTFKSPGGAFVQNGRVRLPDGRAADLSLDEFGTMHVTNPALKVGARAIVFDQQVGMKAEEQEAWGITSRWFLRGGRPYIVHFDGWGPGYPIYVGAVTSTLEERPICRLKARVWPQVRPAPGAGQAARSVCRAAADRELKSLGLQPLATRIDAPERTLLAGMMRRTASVRVDAANTGRPQTLFLFEGDSSAGGGCELKYFDTASPRDSSPAHRGLMAAQGLSLNDNAYARRTCADDRPSWFVHDGRTYLMSHAQRAFDSNPGDERNEFLSVDTLDGARARQVCVGDYSRRLVRITDVWSGAGWRGQPSAKPAATPKNRRD